MLNVETAEVRRATSMLNRCVEISVDGQKFFSLAAANVRSPRLKEMFQGYSNQRAQFVISLQTELMKAGVTPENEGTIGGAARRELMEVLHSLEINHRDLQVVRECVNELTAALRVYASVARIADTLSVDLRVLLDEQKAVTQKALEDTLRLLDAH